MDIFAKMIKLTLLNLNEVRLYATVEKVAVKEEGGGRGGGGRREGGGGGLGGRKENRGREEEGGRRIEIRRADGVISVKQEALGRLRRGRKW